MHLNSFLVSRGSDIKYDRHLDGQTFCLTGILSAGILCPGILSVYPEILVGVLL